MKIQWLGHSSFRITGSKTVVTDPFGGIGLDYPTVRADIVTVSHGHFDHNAVESVSGEPAVVDDAGLHKVADVTIKGYNTAHDDAQGAKRGGNIIYLITMDGCTVAHLGDLGCALSRAQLDRLRGLDALLIPVGGYYTIDASQAQELVEDLKPRIVVPMHYRSDTFGYEVIARLEDFLALRSDVVRYPGSALEITPHTPTQTAVLTYRF